MQHTVHRQRRYKYKIKKEKKRAECTPPDHNWEFQRPTENQKENHLSCVVSTHSFMVKASPHCVEVTRSHQTTPGHCRGPFQVMFNAPCQGGGGGREGRERTRGRSVGRGDTASRAVLHTHSESSVSQFTGSHLSTTWKSERRVDEIIIGNCSL